MCNASKTYFKISPRHTLCFDKFGHHQVFKIEECRLLGCGAV
jgi:hypothetical protein